MTLISQQCRAKCSKGARQSSIRGMKSELPSPGARESLSWGWDRAGSSKAAKRAAVHGTAEAQDQDIPQYQREEQLHNPVLSKPQREEVGPWARMGHRAKWGSQQCCPHSHPQPVTVLPDSLAVPKGDVAE